MFGLGTQELLVFGILAVLLFGKRLPEVAKTLGSSYRDFRKGLNDIQRQMDINRYLDDDTSASTWSRSEGQPAAPPTVPKFELPEGQRAPAEAGGLESDESQVSEVDRSSAAESSR
jgi:sec-independent protein translocase protein TatA